MNQEAGLLASQSEETDSVVYNMKINETYDTIGVMTSNELNPGAEEGSTNTGKDVGRDGGSSDGIELCGKNLAGHNIPLTATIPCKLISTHLATLHSQFSLLIVSRYWNHLRFICIILIYVFILLF